MDLPTLPPLPMAAPTSSGIPTSAAASASAMILNYPDSIGSSPRSHNADTWDDQLHPVPGLKLRLMCSYGGHIIPRPHDKSLCYVGGETRMVVIDRHSSLSEVCKRISFTLLNGRHFTLKYQLPNEDLDSLISVSTDEDLENMIEEYDRTVSSSPVRPSRLRLFLFFSKPETVASMGCLLDDAKSETWFVDVLNNAGIPKGVSDSATMDCLLNNLDGVYQSDSCNDLEGQDHFEHNKDPVIMKNGQDVEDSSISNLPPIRVRVAEDGGRLEDQKVNVGVEEQFSQINFNALPPLPTTMPNSAGTMLSAGMSNYNENMNRVSSDDERSDHGVPVGFRKPPLPLQTSQNRSGGGGGGGFSLPSPDSVTSDSSITSANSLSKAMNYQDQIQDPANTLPPQSDQQPHLPPPAQQFIHPSPHYIHRPVPGTVPVPSYYPVYPQPSQQLVHHTIDQQYPVYLMPVTQTQPYNMPIQSNICENPAIVPSSATLYPPQAAITAQALQEMAASKYKTGVVSSSPTLVQVRPNQYQQQYVGFQQMHHPSQSTVASSTNVNYGFEYANPASNDQMYYSEHPSALPSQYQTMNQAAAVGTAVPSDPPKLV